MKKANFDEGLLQISYIYNILESIGAVVEE